MSAYRDQVTPTVLDCPRCKKHLPPLDVARCAGKCGAWVSAFAATEVLTETDRRPDPVTRWWKRREPCPVCGEQMTLRGSKPGLFQGCDGHGYWLDSDAIPETGLARGIDEAALERKREDRDRMDADRKQRVDAEAERDRQKREKEEREAIVADAVVAPPVVFSGAGSESPTVQWAKMAVTLNPLAASVLGRRFSELEARNAELEARISSLEKLVRQTSS